MAMVPLLGSYDISYGKRCRFLGVELVDQAFQWYRHSVVNYYSILPLYNLSWPLNQEKSRIWTKSGLVPMIDNQRWPPSEPVQIWFRLLNFGSSDECLYFVWTFLVQTQYRWLSELSLNFFRKKIFFSYRLSSDSDLNSVWTHYERENISNSPNLINVVYIIQNNSKPNF